MSTEFSNAVSLAIKIVFNFWYVWIFLVVLFFVLMFLIKRRTVAESFKPFVPIKLKDTLSKRLKDKMRLYGHVFNGEMYISYTRIGRIGKYIKAKGKNNYEIFDPISKEIKVDNENSTDYDILICEKVHDFILFRILGIFREFVILERQKDGKEMYKMDMINRRIFIFDGTDLTSYGNVWTNTDSGIEYLNNISTVRTLEQIKTHLENLPDKYSHLEMEQAKRERLKKIETELEKGKYKERETAGDTTIV